MNEASASQINHHKYQVAIANDIMGRMNEIQQAERIARHYLSHAANAQALLRIFDITRYDRELTEETQAAIKYIAQQIRNNHAYDLGIELSWTNQQ